MKKIKIYLGATKKIRKKIDFYKIAKGFAKEELYVSDNTKEVKINALKNICNMAVNLGRYTIEHDGTNENSYLRIFVIGKNIYIYADCMGYIVRVMISDYNKRLEFIKSVYFSKLINLSSAKLFGYRLIKFGGDHGDNGNKRNPIRYGVYSFEYKSKEGKRKTIRVQMQVLNYLLANPKAVEMYLFNNNLVINHKRVSVKRNYVVDVELNSALNLEICTRSLNALVGTITNEKIKNNEIPVKSIKDIEMTLSEVCQRHKLDIDSVILQDGNILDKYTGNVIYYREHLCKVR